MAAKQEFQLQRRIPQELTKDPVVLTYLGHLVGRTKPPTQTEIAEQTGVSRKTVVRTLTRSGLWDEVRLLETELKFQTRDITREIELVYLGHLAARTSPPSYAELAAEKGVSKQVVYDAVKAVGLQEKLARLRKETSPGEVFTPSRESAWFLGVLFGNRGKVDKSRNELSLTMSPEEEAVLTRFQDIGTSLLSTEKVLKTAVIHQTDGGNRRVSFHSHRGIRETGSFTKAERARKMRKDFKWVLSDQYVTHFASGVLDASAAIVQKGQSQGVFINTGFEDTADYLETMFRRLGVTGVRKETTVYTRALAPKNLDEPGDFDDEFAFSDEMDNTISEPRYVIKIQRREDLQVLAKKVTLHSPAKHALMERWKTVEKKKRTYTFPTSALDIYKEWIKLKDQFGGEPPKTHQITQARLDGQDTFAQSVYTKHFGYDEKTGKSSFVTATNRLLELEALDPQERRRILAKIEVFQKKPYTELELRTEWTKLRFLPGDLTFDRIRQLHRKGETPYPPHLYRRYFGKTDDGKLSFTKAQEVLDQYTTASK